MYCTPKIATKFVSNQPIKFCLGLEPNVLLLFCVRVGDPVAIVSRGAYNLGFRDVLEQHRGFVPSQHSVYLCSVRFAFISFLLLNIAQFDFANFVFQCTMTPDCLFVSFTFFWGFGYFWPLIFFFFWYELDFFRV